VEVVIISDDEDKQPPAGKGKTKRRKKTSYFSPSFTFEQAKRFYDDFLEQEDSWDPQPEEPFHGNPQHAELSPPVFAHSSDDGKSDDSDTQPKRARLNPIFKARIDATLGASTLGRAKPKSKSKNPAQKK